MSQKYQFYISALCRSTIKLIDGNTEWSGLTLSLHAARLVGDNTDLLSDINISKTARVNKTLTSMFVKDYSVDFLMIPRLTDFVLLVL